jgi:hypothetical protein
VDLDRQPVAGDDRRQVLELPVDRADLDPAADALVDPVLDELGQVLAVEPDAQDDDRRDDQDDQPDQGA